MPQFAMMTIFSLALVLALCTYWFCAQQRNDEQHSAAKPCATFRGLQMMDGMLSEDPVVSLACNAHISYTNWEPNANGVWQHQHVLARPGR